MVAASSTKSKGPVVDLNALRTNQMFIVVLSAIAFVLGADIGRWIVLFVGLSLAIGASRPGYGPFQLLYQRVLRPRGIVKPRVRSEDPAPHRFAQAMGGAFLLIASVFLIGGATTIGWILVWIVVALALANLTFGFCAGCFIFFQLQRAGVLGGART